ncbi:MAG: kinase [Candidatus Methanomethylophilaceae archaeon]|jgi:D-glycero-alpha-D-manno-heptose-7-phosphate kinase
MHNQIIRARAPLRIGIAGGGTDVDPYASMKGGKVLNTTIDKYAYCTIVPNGTNTMTVKSLDYGKYEVTLDGGPLSYDGNLDLIKVVTNHFGISEGFDMFIHSDAPPGSGLGGSSTVIVSILSAVSEWKELYLSKYEMADLAYRLEREKLNLKGGKQDQYAAVFGGFNLMEFSKEGVRINSIDMKESTIDELQYCSLLCYTGRARESANIIESQVKNFKDGMNEDALDESKRLAVDMGEALKKGKVHLVGELLDQTWMYKKKFTSKISNPQIDDLYETAKKNGAIGGKVSGAGGGGFMYFICEYDKKHIVASELKARGAVITDFMFEHRGVRSWRCED